MTKDNGWSSTKGYMTLQTIFYTLNLENGYPTYKFFPDEVTDLISNNAGSDVTDQWGSKRRIR